MTDPTTDTIAPAPPAALDKTFDPAAIEAKWYAHWEQNGLFRPDRPQAPPFTIVNPPPNVTGSLHIGHALDNTLQDIVVRYERLRGKDALWVVGTDHAGIATQMVVERELEAAQDKRANYTREQFVEKVWAWKAQSGGTITQQLRRLGCSMDWSREQFTMDPHFTHAVTKAFVDLYNQGLIYRDKRLVNWDPKLKTAISDLEVETQEIKGHFWHFRYPLADGAVLDSGANHIVVATTRPETMLADMAVAVNAADPRYHRVIGKFVTLPITGRRIPIVADDHANPALGSGAVKITPGHDFNDFEVGKRAGFAPAAMLNMFDAEANVAQVADGLIPARFLGLHRFRRDGGDGAREAVVAELKASGHLVLHEVKGKDGEVALAEAEDRVIQTPFGDRGGVVIEPWLTDQWYVNAAELAKAPIAAVRDGRIEIVPRTWEKTWFNWMENIQPWCVSRQLWWGHRIPAWFDESGRIFVAETEAEAQTLAGAGISLTRDPDVLDTWFSSALWPFATLGWPHVPPRNGEGDQRSWWRGTRGDALDSKQGASPPVPLHHPADGPPPRSGEELLARHYPNDLLVSGFDILFFWCARMAMQGMHFMHEVPWRRLYLHGLVRAADGQKMSKSKGNVVDPLGLIDKYGADALRFFMAAMESQGRDVKMDERRVEGYRNFATKLWNAARFLQSNGVAASITAEIPSARADVNAWIIGEVLGTVIRIDEAMASLRFDEAALIVYHFVWDRFCDDYIEDIKGTFDPETSRVAAWAFDQILVMLHPFMPFITEELWHAMGTRSNELIVSDWLDVGAGFTDRYFQPSNRMNWLHELISKVRSVRTDLEVPPGSITQLVPGTSTCQTSLELLNTYRTLAERRARVKIMHPAMVDGPHATVTFGEEEFFIPLEGVIDIAAEKARLTKALETSTKDAKSLEGRLNNPAFIEKAKLEAVEKARADHAAHAAEAERLAAALTRLG